MAKENGIPGQTLFRWKRHAKSKGIVITDGEAQSEKWSTQDEFMVVVETATLNSAELAKAANDPFLYPLFLYLKFYALL